MITILFFFYCKGGQVYEIYFVFCRGGYNFALILLCGDVAERNSAGGITGALFGGEGNGSTDNMGQAHSV